MGARNSKRKLSRSRRLISRGVSAIFLWDVILNSAFLSVVKDGKSRQDIEATDGNATLEEDGVRQPVQSAPDAD
jgi:hypothetical protein